MPTPAANEAHRLIDRSIARSEIAHAPWTAELADALENESENAVDTADTFEAWGIDDDDQEWRVHLDKRADGATAVQ